MTYYFAYGSNMDSAQMKQRCPTALLRGSASLPHYSLAFTIFSPKRLCGCADIIASLGSVTYGLLYQLTEEELAMMDVFEGHPIHYKRIKVSVIFERSMIDAYSYEVVTKKENQKPSRQYLDLLQSAAKKYNFPEAYQDFLNTFKTL